MHKENGSERRLKWPGFPVCFFFSSLYRLYFHGGPSVSSSRPWPGWHDWMFRLNPNLFRHNVVVMMEMESEKLIEGRVAGESLLSDREGEGRVWSGIVEMSRQVRMHWFRITFLFHFNRRMLPFREDAILISRLRPNICTIQIGGYGGNVIQTRNIALSSYPAQPYWCFWAFHCSAKMKSFRARAIDRLRKHTLFCWTWQRLSCYLNNMSSAEVAPKHYLENIVRLNSRKKLQPARTTKDSNCGSESTFSSVVATSVYFFSFSFIILETLITMFYFGTELIVAKFCLVALQIFTFSHQIRLKMLRYMWWHSWTLTKERNWWAENHWGQITENWSHPTKWLQWLQLVWACSWREGKKSLAGTLWQLLLQPTYIYIREQSLSKLIW